MTSPSERADTLRAELAEIGLELRDDSHLCRMFVEDGVGSVQAIAEVMCEMEWFFRKTGYVRAKRVVRREHDGIVDLDSFEVSELAKNRALRWLVRAGDEETLMNAPTTLRSRIEWARKVVALHP